MVILLAATIMAATADSRIQSPGPRPSSRQLEWHRLEYYGFVHFGPNTFTGREWGEGKEDPSAFNPTQLDCRQWVRTFKEAGMKQVIITAKHHDGFCLWPTKYSVHTVAQSKWRSGKGDVLHELRRACDEYGMKMGVYLSPWDRNHPTYGTPEYNQVFASMLKEVLTRYGPIYEVWFDGANGEGPNGKRQVYDWELFISTVRKYAPKAVIFSDAGPDIRWVGNESGIAGETCWATIDKSSPKAAIGAADQRYLNEGDPNGPDWVPAECDVSIRPGWFYHAAEDSKVKTPEQLLDIYEKSVGRGGALLLNVPPDRRGLIHENDVNALMEFKKLRDQIYSRPLGTTRKTTVQRKKTPVTGGPTDWNARFLSFKSPKVVDRLVLSETIEHGQKVESFVVRALDGPKVIELAMGTSIGWKKVVSFKPVQTETIWVLLKFKDQSDPAVLIHDVSLSAYGPGP